MMQRVESDAVWGLIPQHIISPRDVDTSGVDESVVLSVVTKGWESVGGKEPRYHPYGLFQSLPA